ncbi:MAG: hypothetical protein ABIS29_07965 [Vicinamibacterales bacterium]
MSRRQTFFGHFRCRFTSAMAEALSGTVTVVRHVSHANRMLIVAVVRLLHRLLPTGQIGT